MLIYFDYARGCLGLRGVFTLSYDNVLDIEDSDFLGLPTFRYDADLLEIVYSDFLEIVSINLGRPTLRLFKLLSR